MAYDFEYREFINTYDLHAEDLLGFVYSYVNDREAARDIVHDLFAQLWAQRAQVDTSRPLKPLLFTLGRNHALNHLRHARVVAGNSEALARELYQAHRSDDTGIPDLETLRAGLAALPDKQREVLLMCVVGNKMYREAADELGISVNTVKTHLRRALHSLRGDLGIMLLLALLSRG